MKKIILIVVVILIGGFIGYIYLTSQSHGTADKGLSERSKEFLKGQAAQGNLEFAGVNTKTNGSLGNTISSENIDVDKCFSLQIPFPIEQNRSMGKCFNQITTSDPRATINVYIRDVSFNSVDDDPGVVMRRNDSKAYKEEKVSIEGKQFVVFKKTDGGYEASALYQNGTKQFSLNLIASIGDDSFDSKFSKMLESVVIK